MNSSPSQPVPEHRQRPLGSLLVVRLGAMGDLIHAIAAVSALRAALSECRVGWVVEERWSSLLCAPGFPPRGIRAPERPLVDDLFTVDIRALRSNPACLAKWMKAHGCIADLRAAGYECGVDIQGAIRSALILRLSGITNRWGEITPRETVAAMFYRKRIDVAGKHVAQQNLALISSVAGLPLKWCTPLFPRDSAAADWCKRLLARHSRYCILNPGAGWGAKCWCPSSFAEVASRLAETGVGSLVNFGPGEEHLAQQVVEASGGAAEAVSCTVSQLIELTRRAELFIGGDTGPMHLAAALGVPVVALFGPTNPQRNGPWGTRSIVLRSQQSATSYRHTAKADAALQSIPPIEVANAALRLLRQQSGVAVRENF